MWNILINFLFRASAEDRTRRRRSGSFEVFEEITFSRPLVGTLVPFLEDEVLFGILCVLNWNIISIRGQESVLLIYTSNAILLKRTLPWRFVRKLDLHATLKRVGQRLFSLHWRIHHCRPLVSSGGPGSRRSLYWFFSHRLLELRCNPSWGKANQPSHSTTWHSVEAFGLHAHRASRGDPATFSRSCLVKGTSSIRT